MMRTTCVIVSLLVLVLLCAPATRAQEIEFADVTREAGLIGPLAGMMGHGGAWGDFNGDGRADLYVGGFCDRPDEKYHPAKGPVPNRLFRNRGDGTFEPVENSPTEIVAHAPLPMQCMPCGTEIAGFGELTARRLGVAPAGEAGYDGG